MEKNILITGASGFIGSFLAEEAVKRGWQTWAGVRKSSSREYLTDQRTNFIDLNYADPVALKRQLIEHTAAYGQWDYIVHNAGLTKCLHPDDFYKVNFIYTCNLIEALKESGNVPKKFILMSSLSAYPDTSTIYGKSKLKAERYLQAQSRFPFVILRPTGVYGPRERDYFLMIKSIRSGLNVTAGFKPQQLTFIYVKDLVKAAFLALESEVSGRVYAVSDGAVYLDKEFTGIVKDLLNKKCVLNIKIPLFILKTVSIIAEETSKWSGKASTLNRDKYKIMKQRDWTCDSSSLQLDLNFQPDYDLKKGLQEAIAWYKGNHWL